MDDETDTSNFVCVDPHRGCYSISTLGIRSSCMKTRRRRMPLIQTLMEPSPTMQTYSEPMLSRRGERTVRHFFRLDPMRIRKPMHLPVHVLRTCRQIYHEMNPIIYSANTFSIQSVYILPRFPSNFSSNALIIRHLHLHIKVKSESAERKWNGSLRAAARRFSNLHSIDISIDQAIWNCANPLERKNPSMSKKNTFLVGMSDLRKLKFLRKMTLVVTDVYPWEAWKPSKFLWSGVQKQEWVGRVRAEILGGDKR